MRVLHLVGIFDPEKMVEICTLVMLIMEYKHSIAKNINYV